MLELLIKGKITDEEYSNKKNTGNLTGRRVMIKPDCCESRFKNKKGTVVKARANNSYVGIEFDEYVDGHECGGAGEEGYCWNIQIKDIKVIEEEEEWLIF